MIYQERIDGVADFARSAGGALVAKGLTAAGITRLVRKADLLADEQLAFFRDRTEEAASKGESPPIACKKGCSHCCFQIVGISVAEALTIAEHVAANYSEEELSSLLARMEAHLAAQSSLPLGEPFIHACPFLVDDACSIFTVRPLVCRGFESFDAEACRAFKQAPGQVVVERPLLSRTLSGAVAAGLRSGFAGAPQMRYVLELVAGTHAAITVENAAERTASGERLFRSACLPLMKGAQSSVDAEGGGVIRSVDQLLEFCRLSLGYEAPRPPFDIDFEQNMLLYYFLGERADPGHEVRIVEFEAFPGPRMRVTALEIVPEATAKGASPERPWVVIQTRRMDGPIEFVKETEFRAGD